MLVLALIEVHLCVHGLNFSFSLHCLPQRNNQLLSLFSPGRWVAAHAEAPAVDVTKLGMENPEVKTMLDKAMKDAMERLDSKNAEMKVRK